MHFVFGSRVGFSRPTGLHVHVLISDIVALLAVHLDACQVYLTVLGLHLFCDYRNCGTTQANHNFPDFSLTNPQLIQMGVHHKLLTVRIVIYKSEIIQLLQYRY